MNRKARRAEARRLRDEEELARSLDASVLSELADDGVDVSDWVDAIDEEDDEEDDE